MGSRVGAACLPESTHTGGHFCLHHANVLIRRHPCKTGIKLLMWQHNLNDISRHMEETV